MITAAKNLLKSAIPDNVLLGQLAMRRSSLWQKAGMVFIHVPKNGGTSINNAIYGQFMGHYRVRDVERVRPKIHSELPSLGLSRNPWARLYSAYRFAKAGAEMSDGAQIRHQRKYRGDSFRTFEAFVVEYLPSQNLDREDYVFRSQSHFLEDAAGNIGVDHLGRIEEMDSYLAFLEETLGRKLDIGHLNRTTEKAAYRDAYTPEMKAMVGKIYAMDVERFKYDF